VCVGLSCAYIYTWSWYFWHVKSDVIRVFVAEDVQYVYFCLMVLRRYFDIPCVSSACTCLMWLDVHEV